MILPGRYFRLLQSGKWVEHSMAEALASCCGVNLAEFLARDGGSCGDR
jgi:hypothetical protein